MRLYNNITAAPLPRKIYFVYLSYFLKKKERIIVLGPIDWRTTIPMLFFSPVLHSSMASSMTRFMNGSKPRRTPVTIRAPFSRTSTHNKTKTRNPINLWGCVWCSAPLHWSSFIWHEQGFQPTVEHVPTETIIKKTNEWEQQHYQIIREKIPQTSLPDGYYHNLWKTVNRNNTF